MPDVVVQCRNCRADLVKLSLNKLSRVVSKCDCTDRSNGVKPSCPVYGIGKSRRRSYKQSVQRSLALTHLWHCHRNHIASGKWSLSVPAAGASTESWLRTSPAAETGAGATPWPGRPMFSSYRLRPKGSPGHASQSSPQCLRPPERPIIRRDRRSAARGRGNAAAGARQRQCGRGDASDRTQIPHSPPLKHAFFAASRRRSM